MRPSSVDSATSRPQTLTRPSRRGERTPLLRRERPPPRRRSERPPLVQSGATAGAAAISWNTEVSSSQWFSADRAADDLDEQRPGQQAVDDGGRGPRPDAQREHADAEEAERRRHDVQAGAEQAAEAHAGVLARGAQPGAEPGDAGRWPTGAATATATRPASHDQRETGRTRRCSRRPWASSARRAPTCPAAIRATSSATMQERHAEIGGRPGPGRAESREGVLDRRRARERARSADLATTPMSSAARGDRHRPGDDAGPHQAHARPQGPNSSRVRGRALARSGSVAAPRSRRPARTTVRTASSAMRATDGQRAPAAPAR